MASPLTISDSSLVLPSDLDNKALTLAKQTLLDPSKPEAVMTLGASAQQSSAAISSSLLQHVQMKDTGETGNLLGELALKCKSVDVNSLAPNWRSNLMKVPLLGGLFSHVQVGMEKYSSTLGELDTISKKLDGSRLTLLSDIKSLGVLFDQNQATYNELKLWIKVGNIKRDELDAQTAAFTPSNDALEMQKQSDVKSLRDRLDKHINDLELTAAIRLQNAPKIRIIQSGNIQLAEKLQSSVLNTIPLWKDNLALVITQQRQKQALEIQNQVDDTTNALLKSSADLLHDNSIAIAKSSTRGIVDIETLQHAQDKLLSTITDVQAIMQDAANQRSQTRTELVRMEDQLRGK